MVESPGLVRVKYKSFGSMEPEGTGVGVREWNKIS